MSQISCPHCGQAFTIPPEQWSQYQGRSITCTKCHQPFAVGVPVAAAPPMMGAHPGAYVPQPQAKSSNKSVLWIVLGIVGVVVIGFIVLLAAILLPALNRAREQANRAKCANNIRQISLACILYANDSKGRFPEKIDQLVSGQLAQDLSSSVWVCPATTHTPSTNSGSSLASDLNAGGHLDYVYVGSKLKATAGYNAILVYEPLETHKEGSNFGFVDGHVEFVKKAEAEKMIADLKAGINPPKTKPSPF